MHKEAIIAVIIGFMLGFLTASGIFFWPKFSQKKESTQLPPVLEKGKSTPAPKEPVLSINAPEENQIIEEETVKVIGRTKPNSLVIIQSSQEDLVVKADPAGNFEEKIDLSEGIEELALTTYLPNGETETIKRKVLVIPSE